LCGVVTRFYGGQKCEVRPAGHLKLFHQLRHNAVFTLFAPDLACRSRHHDEPAAP
jgi:hypothetical protein